MDSIITVSEAAERLRVSKATIYAYVASEKITHLRVGSKILFEAKDLDEWIEKNKKHIAT